MVAVYIVVVMVTDSVAKPIKVTLSIISSLYKRTPTHDVIMGFQEDWSIARRHVSRNILGGVLCLHGDSVVTMVTVICSDWLEAGPIILSTMIIKYYSCQSLVI
jgi:hypothetical protein